LLGKRGIPEKGKKRANPNSNFPTRFLFARIGGRPANMRKGAWKKGWQVVFFPSSRGKKKKREPQTKVQEDEKGGKRRGGSVDCGAKQKVRNFLNKGGKKRDDIKGQATRANGLAILGKKKTPKKGGFRGKKPYLPHCRRERGISDQFEGPG